VFATVYNREFLLGDVTCEFSEVRKDQRSTIVVIV